MDEGFYLFNDQTTPQSTMVAFFDVYPFFDPILSRASITYNP